VRDTRRLQGDQSCYCLNCGAEYAAFSPTAGQRCSADLHPSRRQPRRWAGVCTCVQSGRQPCNRLSERAVNFILKEVAERTGVAAHADASHAIDDGAPIALVSVTRDPANPKPHEPARAVAGIWTRGITCCQRASGRKKTTAALLLCLLFEGLPPVPDDKQGYARGNIGKP
jgi:hypothetical protein